MPEFDDPEKAFLAARKQILKNKTATRLEFSGWGLNALPPEIGQCHALTFLDLTDNQLSTLPAELSECTNLRVLVLFTNQFRTVPSVVAKCPMLQGLYLDYNNLRTFPSVVLQCARLTSLSLTGTLLSGLPDNIDKLDKLEVLYLDKNRIVRLPKQICNLMQLGALYLHDNDALGIPPELLGPTSADISRDTNIQPVPPKSILDYYFSRVAKGKRSLDEVKMILVGRGGSGKTSLVNRLVFNRFNKGEKETPGVVITDWIMHGCPSGGPVTAHVWDFAGQVITHAMHQFFFSTRTVYVLVLTGRENAEREDAEYWLRLISAFGTEQNRDTAAGGEVASGPPVIVVLNKWEDEGSARARLDRSALRERYPFIVGFIETDCETTCGMTELRAKLCITVGEMKWVRSTIAEPWARVKERLRENPDPHLGYDVFRTICVEEGITEKSEQDSLASALHALGVALNYRDDKRLNFASVLKPHWLTENVYALVRYAEKKFGVLPRASLPSVLAAEKDGRMRRFLVDMMVRFELAYPLAEEGAEPERWLVPQALPDDQPSAAEGFLGERDATRLRFSYRALPANIVPQFIVRTHTFLERGEGDERVQWASGAVLARAGARALVRADRYERILEVIATGPLDARQQLAGLCQAELRAIHALIPGLNPHEETEVEVKSDGRTVRGWVSVSSLRSSEQKKVKGALSVDTEPTVMFDPTPKLNEFTKPAARDGSWKPRVFICYSQKDDRSRRTLEMHLKILHTQGMLEATWTDQALDPGDDWDQRIKQELEQADVILMLVSTEALATDYIQKIEMPRALERHAAGDAVAVAVILKKCSYQKTPLGKWQAILPNRKPVLDNSPQRDGWAVVEEKLHALFARLRTRGPVRRKSQTAGKVVE